MDLGIVIGAGLLFLLFLLKTKLLSSMEEPPNLPRTRLTCMHGRRVNDVVISWLLSSLEPSIAKSVQWHRTAKEIWDELQERYGCSSNAQLYSLQEELGQLTHDPDMSIVDFYTKFKTIWDELDHLNPLPICSCDECSCKITQQFYKLQQNQRLTHFLMKLDPKYSHIRSTILMMPELPTIAHAYQQRSRIKASIPS